MSELNNELSQDNKNENFLHPEFPGQITGEMVIEENQIHKADVYKGMQLCYDILKFQAKHHDLDKDVPENAEILAQAINTGDFKEWNERYCYKQMHHYQCYMQSDITTLFDLLESVVDGVVANSRREQKFRTYEEEYEFFKRAGFDDFMCKVMTNTFMMLQKIVWKDDSFNGYKK